MEDPKTIKLNCGKCGTEMRLHKPMLTRMDDGLVSVVMLVPNWSPEERICRSCGYIVTPIFGKQLPIEYVCLPPMKKPEESRIITPGPIPFDLEKKLKVG